MKCEMCQKDITSCYGSGRFCSSYCARGFSTSKNRDEISMKVSKTLTKPLKFISCGSCGTSLQKGLHKKYCNQACQNADEALKRLRSTSLSKTLKAKFANNLELRTRMREIGRFGGFGTRCKTESGINCDSLFEKRGFEILEFYSIKFIPHKVLPNSSRISDAYLPEFDTWIEIDGINREKRYTDKTSSGWLQWDGKIKEYNRLNLTVKIFTCHEQIEDFCKTLRV